MRYIGGKSRSAKQLANVMLAATPEREIYVEPFVGAGSVACEMVPQFDRSLLSDSHPDLVELLRGVAGGWEPPCTLSRDAYEALRLSQPSPLRAWAGFAASYNGKWFGGYGPRAEAAGRDYLAEARRSVVRDGPLLAGAVIRHADYLEAEPLPGAVVYCDPPYEGTMAYAGVSHPFDRDKFWSTMDDWSETSHVFVSEFTAPDGWTAIWSVGRQATVHHAGSTPSRPDCLWMRK